MEFYKYKNQHLEYQIKENIYISSGVISEFPELFSSTSLPQKDRTNGVNILLLHEGLSPDYCARDTNINIFIGRKLADENIAENNTRADWYIEFNTEKYGVCAHKFHTNQNLFFSVSSLEYLIIFIYVVSNVKYRMGRWFSEICPKFDDSLITENQYPLDVTCINRVMSNTRYKRASDLYETLSQLNIVAGIAFKDNVYIRNALFFKDRIRRAIFAFNRHIRNSDDYILWPLSEYQRFGDPNFRIFSTPYEEKRKFLFWRGSPTGTSNTEWGNGIYFKVAISRYSKEDSLIFQFIAKNYPRFQFVYKNIEYEFADIGFTEEIPHFKYMKKEKVSLEYANTFLFHAAIDGNDLPSSLPWQLINGNIVFMAPLTFESLFTYNLKPWIHYVPVRSDFELIDKVFYDVVNDESLLRSISANTILYMRPFCNNKIQKLIDQLILYRYSLINGAINEDFYMPNTFRYVN
jgi:hypothetical protein